MRKLMHQLLDDSLRFIFPPVCVCCNLSYVPQTEGTDSLSFCGDCSESLLAPTEHACQRCSARIGPFSKDETGCIHCRSHRFHFHSVTCLGMYEDHLRKVMLSAKWSFTSVPIVALSNALVRKQQTALEATNPDLIIPIPQHWRKRLFRHFNPAWLIATTIANKIGGKCDAHLLRRCRTTKPQKRMSISARRNNQKDTFALVDEWMIRGKRILLVDDVLTTGATCSEAARILRNAGAEECHVAVIGRVLDHSA